jgi:menaquinone-9 beta-reductase
LGKRGGQACVPQMRSSPNLILGVARWRAYTSSINRLQPKYEVYRKAEFLFNWPYLTNKLVTHADNSFYIRSKLEGLFNETNDPAFLLTLSGWWKILFNSGNEVQNLSQK